MLKCHNGQLAHPQCLDTSRACICSSALRTSRWLYTNSASQRIRLCLHRGRNTSVPCFMGSLQKELKTHARLCCMMWHWSHFFMCYNICTVASLVMRCLHPRTACWVSLNVHKCLAWKDFWDVANNTSS